MGAIKSTRQTSWKILHGRKATWIDTTMMGDIDPQRRAADQLMIYQPVISAKGAIDQVSLAFL